MLDAGATRMALGRAALVGDADTLAKWEPEQLELGRRLLARSAAMGTRSQVDCSWEPADPKNRFGLHGPSW